MGLDMYMFGLEPNKSTITIRENSSSRNELAYWRKHANLHGYIVDTFADGLDECQKINLSLEDLKKILNAVEINNLPETTGFFFGKSRTEDREPSIKQLVKVISWVNEVPGRKVYYQASW